MFFLGLAVGVASTVTFYWFSNDSVRKHLQADFTQLQLDYAKVRSELDEMKKKYSFK